MVNIIGINTGRVNRSCELVLSPPKEAPMLGGVGAGGLNPPGYPIGQMFCALAVASVTG